MTKRPKFPKETVEQLTKKIESDVNDIRNKYPEIAKMTVAEVVAKDEFAIQLKKAVLAHKVNNYYAFKSLKQNKTFETDNFRTEYIACMDKESNMPVSKRTIVLAIGNDAYRRTVLEMMKQVDLQNMINNETK